LEVDRKIETINIHVRPALRKIDDNVTAGYILVIFERTASTTEKTEHAGVILRSDESVSRHLEEELARMKMQLRTSSEQHEFQAEELKASNEELQAMNEELRSAAEELETSKEELQSMNEELRTVNQELKVKIEETTLTSNNLQNLINSANIGTIFLDRSFRVAMFTPAVRNVFNLIPADNGRPLTDITHKLENDTLLQDAEQVLDRLTTIEREVKTTDNHWFIMRVLPYRTAEDHINGVVITFTDITSRKEAENKVQEFREKMQKAFSIETVGIIFFHTTGKITDANDAFLAMCGYSREDLKANRITWDTITPAEFLPQSKHALEQIQREGRNEPYERQYMRKDGARCWGLFSGTRINKDEAVKFVVDITAQKLLQQQKDEFIAIASHELKTPVTSIKVYTEVLRNMFHATGDKEHTELMDKLDAQVDRLNTLIKDLLDNDNIAEGKLVLKKELTDINALVLRHVEEMQRVAARHCIIFTPQKLPLINADRERIAQVLTNLIFNAIKYSPEGGDVIITAYQRDKEITVSVKDSGIGIPALDIEHVFDRFFRTNHVPSQNFPGMGLGLYISAGIIQRHNGNIGVSSKEGEGSTFWFTLPVN
ncbi:MAG TPA: ATP-binding protein, partial [Chitinophagaceae bacterium]|nr:ATP-binding protein [Chitinophagaceae bacterium]